MAGVKRNYDSLNLLDSLKHVSSLLFVVILESHSSKDTNPLTESNRPSIKPIDLSLLVKKFD